MVTIHLTGHISESGEIKIDVPEGMQLPSGDVRVTLEIAHHPAPSYQPDDLSWEERPWTDEELAELLKVKPKSGAEALAELAALDAKYGNPWADLNITGAEWVEEQRRKKQAKFPKW